jgi:hypothetical protein
MLLLAGKHAELELASIMLLLTKKDPRTTSERLLQKIRPNQKHRLAWSVEGHRCNWDLSGNDFENFQSLWKLLDTDRLKLVAAYEKWHKTVQPPNKEIEF